MPTGANPTMPATREIHLLLVMRHNANNLGGEIMDILVVHTRVSRKEFLVAFFLTILTVRENPRTRLAAVIPYPLRSSDVYLLTPETCVGLGAGGGTDCRYFSFP